MEISQALDAVARLSNGTLKAATLIGGPECGFIAAVAHWFFEIDVEMRTSDGEILQASRKAETRAQLTVIYETHSGRQQVLTSMISSKTYAVHDLKSNLFKAGSASSIRITGRVPWKEALHYTLGRTFEKLAVRQDFGNIIGSAARIFQAISKAEPEGDFNYFQLKEWCAYSDHSYGQGYLNSAISMFPELSALRKTMKLQWIYHTKMRSQLTDLHKPGSLLYAIVRSALVDEGGTHFVYLYSLKSSLESHHVSRY